MKPALMVIRLVGLALLVLGGLFWTGNARELVPVHMLLGLIFVVALAALCGWAVRVGAARGLGWVGVALAVVVLVFGMIQTRLVPGPAHEIIRIVHLLLGVGAMGLAEAVGSRLRAAGPVATES